MPPAPPSRATMEQHCVGSSENVPGHMPQPMPMLPGHVPEGRPILGVDHSHLAELARIASTHPFAPATPYRNLVIPPIQPPTIPTPPERIDISLIWDDSRKKYRVQMAPFLLIGLLLILGTQPTCVSGTYYNESHISNRLMDMFPVIMPSQLDDVTDPPSIAKMDAMMQADSPEREDINLKSPSERGSKSDPESDKHRKSEKKVKENSVDDGNFLNRQIDSFKNEYDATLKSFKKKLQKAHSSTNIGELDEDNAWMRNFSNFTRLDNDTQIQLHEVLNTALFVETGMNLLKSLIFSDVSDKRAITQLALARLI